MAEHAGGRAHMVRFAVVVLLAPLASLVAAQPSIEPSVEGAQLYRSNCAPCHGSGAHGEAETGWLFDPPPPDLHRALQAEATATLVRRILDGPQHVTPSPRAPALTRTQALVSYLERLPRVNWPMAERGRSLYIDRCERCHGVFGHPPAAAIGATGPRPRDLAASPFLIDDIGLAALIRHEREGMPPLTADLSDADVQALVAFVRLLSPGRELYQTACAHCHGDEGIPPARGVSVSVVFDRAYFAANDTRVVAAKVWHMLDDRGPAAMPHFRGKLSQPQAEAIVNHLRETLER